MYSGEPFRRECVVYGAQCRLAQQPFVHGLAQDAKGGNTTNALMDWFVTIKSKKKKKKIIATKIGKKPSYAVQNGGCRGHYPRDPNDVPVKLNLLCDIRKQPNGINRGK